MRVLTQPSSSRPTQALHPHRLLSTFLLLEMFYLLTSREKPRSYQVLPGLPVGPSAQDRQLEPSRMLCKCQPRREYGGWSYARSLPRYAFPNSLLFSYLHMPLSQGQPDLGLSLGSTMLTTESLQQTVSCSPFPSPGVLTMAAEGWCFPPYKISETRPTIPSQSAPEPSPRHRSGEGGSCIQT